ncbi:MAG TPA: hypothetical protein DDW51_05510 [Cyanobacteria bacterium UBA11367]|nr:hypothetical protein [Cyanobacteria bacterium UBA11367]HBE56789.1 hypothetical protein [Cyanobacteria bacterium UBA11366]HCA94651.1 hypothetical protein [Cyanobacteria bacterium UBA9226]
MRSPWVYRAGAIALMFAAGLAIWVDASLSREWIASATSADKVMPNLSTGIAFIIAVLASAFGAIATNPVSWRILFYQSKKVASINDAHERLLNLLGYGMLMLFVFGGFIFIYGVDLVSTYHKVKNIWLTIGIVFSGDLCLMLAVPLWQIGKAADATIREFDNQIGMSSARGRKTVDTHGERFQ